MTATTALAGGVLETSADDDNAGLRRLVDDLGRRSIDRRLGQHRRPDPFDADLWRNLEDTGLSRLTSAGDPDAGPAELAVALRGVAYHAGAVPIAETDLLAAWLANHVGLPVAESGPLTVAVADAECSRSRIAGAAAEVPWTLASAGVVLVVRTSDGLHIGVAEPHEIEVTEGHNLAGEPRDGVRFDLLAERFRAADPSLGDELLRRGAWARCVQIVGALDAAAALSVCHTRERIQFGRPLSAFQAVQQSLAQMAGEIERARAAATLAVAAAADHGFAAAQTDYAVTVAKVVLAHVVRTVTTTAHQLHGAIGSTLEHRLWLFTMRAQAWIGEFGSSGHHARHLGRMALAVEDPWDVVVGTVNPAP